MPPAIRSRETVVPSMGESLFASDADAIKFLKDVQRNMASMQPSEGLWKDTFSYPGYAPEVWDLAGGWETADAMQRLIAYEFPLSLLKAAVLYKGVDIQSAIDDTAHKEYDTAAKIAEECQWLVTSIRNPKTTVSQSIHDILWEHLDACHHGFSVQEKIWRTESQGKLKGKWLLSRIVSRHPDDVGFDLDRNTLEVRHITRRYAPAGETNGRGVIVLPGRSNLPPMEDNYDRRVPTEKFIRYTYKPYRGLPYGRGHFRPCYLPAMSISAGYRLWGRAQEKTGIPFPWGSSNTTNPEVMEEQRKLLDRMMQGISIVVPRDMQLNWVNATQGVSDGFEKFVMHQKMEILCLVLFQSLTTSADGKAAYALGEIHQATQEFALAMVRNAVEWNYRWSLLADYVRYNWGEEYLHLTPKFSLGLWGLAELKLLADIILPYIEKGVIDPREPWVRQIAKFRPRQEVDESIDNVITMGKEKLPPTATGGMPQPGQ